MCTLIQKGNAHTACFLSNFFVATYLSSTYTQDKSQYLHRYIITHMNSVQSTQLPTSQDT